MNWERVENKIKAKIREPGLQKRIGTYIDGTMMTRNASWVTAKGQRVNTAPDIARKFMEALSFVILANEASAPGDTAIGKMGLSAIEALSDLDFTDARKLSRYRYAIGVYFTNDLTRPSLDPGKYGDVQNIAALLNKGFGPTKGSVWGDWHGIQIYGLRARVGAHFLEEARDEFMAIHGEEYGIEKIELAEIYQ